MNITSTSRHLGPVLPFESRKHCPGSADLEVDSLAELTEPRPVATSLQFLFSLLTWFRVFASWCSQFKKHVDIWKETNTVEDRNVWISSHMRIQLVWGCLWHVSIIFVIRSEATPQQHRACEGSEDTLPASESQVMECLGRPPQKQKTDHDLFADTVPNLTQPSASPTSPAPSSSAGPANDDESQ